MGNNPVYGKEIYQSDGSLEKLEADLAKIDGRLKGVETSAKSLQTTTAKLNSTNKQQRDSIKDNSIQADKLSQENKKLKQSYTNTAVEIKKVQEVRKKQNQLTKLEIQLAKSADGSYNKLSAQYSLMKIKLNSMSKARRENTVAGRAMVKQSKELYTRMSTLQKQTGKNTLDVGKYGQGAKQAAGQLLGFATGIGASILVIRKLSQAIKEAVTVWTEYDKATSKVKAISGATADEMKMLSGQAEALGASTEKTAAEVSSLQLELSKLGFDPKQIENATSSILDLSTAIDADLAQSATVVGQTLRAFNMTAAETQRVTDVMAASFSKSSLDISKFQSAMSTVAPVAQTFGFSVEETTALLAQLTDAGFDASSAGTALRNILLNLADSNGDLAQALGGSVTNAAELLDGLDHLNEQGVDLNETLQLTDKRSVAAFNRFLGATDSTRKLTKELEQAGGAAARMAKIMRDNLAGDMDKAKSATQGLYINIGKRLNPSLRSSVQAVTKFVGKLNEYMKLDVAKQIEEERDQVISLTLKLQDANLSYEDRKTLLDELNTIAPDVAAGIDAEEIAYGKLNAQLDTYLQNVIQRIAIAELEAEKEQEIQKFAKLKNKNNELLIIAGERLLAVNEKYRASEGSLQENIKGTIKNLEEYVKVNGRLSDTQFYIDQATGKRIPKLSEEASQLTSLREILKMYTDGEEEANEMSKSTIDRINQKIQLLKEQLGLIDDTNKEGEETIETTVTEDEVVEDYIRTLKILRAQLSKLKAEKELINIDDKAALAQKRREIDLLDAQIKKLEELGAVIDIKAIKPIAFDFAPKEGIDTEKQMKDFIAAFEARRNAKIAQDKALEDLEKKHYGSMLGMFLNFRARRKAVDENMSAEEIARMNEKHEAIEEGLTTAAEFAVDQITQLFEYQVEMADEEIRRSERKVDVAREVLDAEIRARELGLANNVATRNKELEAAKKQQDKANKEKAKAVKQQQALDTITQASSLITATANIWSSLTGIPIVGSLLAVAATALMWGSFAYAKVKAGQVTSYGEGGTFDIGGGTHARGNDTSLGVHGGAERKVEKGEKVSVIKAKAVKQYGAGNINELIKSINKGTFNSNLEKSIVGEADMPSHLITSAGHDTADLRNLEQNVKKIKEQGEERYGTDNNGRRVRYYKNLKQTFIK